MMSQWDKLLARICALSKDLRFDGARCWKATAIR